MDYIGLNILRNSQLVSGEPMYPSGHVQTGSWFTTRQFALGAHGLSYAQGFMHNLFLHAAWSGHSWLLAQPAAKVGSVGGATIKRIILSCLKCSNKINTNKQNKYYFLNFYSMYQNTYMDNIL